MRIILAFLLFLTLVAPTALADESALQTLRAEVVQLKSMVHDLKGIVETQNQTLRLQSARIESLEGARQIAVAGPSASSAGVATAPAAISAGRWNPEIGVVADMTGKFTDSKEDAEGEDRWSVREVELVVGSNVDPYSRLDATIAFSDFEEASLEEAYLTRFELPWDLTGRVGRFKPKAGKALAVHRDGLETVDEPLVIQRWFGAEGYNKTGADVTKVLDLPFVSTHEISAGILEGGNGEDGTLFGDRRRPTYYSHLKNFWELGDASGLEWGITHLIGSKDTRSSHSVWVLATDLTWTHRFSESTVLKVQGEAFHQSRRDSQYEVTDEGTGDVFFEDLEGNLWGGYGLVDLRFAPQWSAGFRGDYVEPVITDLTHPDKAERAYSGYLTFYQSEFSRWRAQVTYFDSVDTPEEDGDWQLWLQGTFAIGEHKHKIT